MYKVVFYLSMNETSVGYKWFNTLREATDFAISKGTDVLEIKWYEDDTLCH